NEYFIAPGETKSFGVCLKVLDKEVNIKEGTKLDLNIILKHVTPVVGNVNGTKLTTADGVIYTLDKENYIAYLGHTGFVGDNLQLAYNKQEIIILPIVSDGTDNYMVTKIDSYAFADFMNGMPEETPGLESIIIPNSVTTIGHSSFLCLTDLSEIQFSKALKAGGVDFSGTSWFENQPDGVVYAGYVACGYKGTISDNLQIKPGTIAISADAFRDTALSSITIPSSVEYIGDYAFDECRSKSVIKIDSQTIVTGLNSFEAQGCLISGSLVTLSVYIKSDLDVTAATYLTNTANFTPEKVGDVVADADGDGYILYTKVGA
ncbi:MAG: leucine-rich repeat protein, partial [Clostridia bacterium]|nr:leucine-rich repeat protein [Clostridia bacterium]